MTVMQTLCQETGWVYCIEGVIRRICTVQCPIRVATAGPQIGSWIVHNVLGLRVGYIETMSVNVAPSK